MYDSFILRPVAIGDLSAIIEIYSHAVINRQTAHTQNPARGHWENWLHSHSGKYPAIAIMEDGNIAGFASFSPYREGRQAFENVAEITYYIHPVHQRRGVGSRMMKELLEIAEKLKFKHLVAILLETNIASIRLLEKTGFEQWGKMPGIAEFESTTTGHLYYGKHIGK